MMILLHSYKQFPKRYILCILAFIGFCLTTMIQSNMAIAILAMVKTNDSQIENEYFKNDNTKTFNWNTKIQGFILSSIWYTVALVQIPAGYLSMKLHLKNSIGISTFILGVCDLFIPLFAQWGALPLIFLRLFEGIFTGAYIPFVYALWSKWIPKQERSIVTTVVFSGIYFGCFMSMVLAGIIARYWHWPWIFYLSGILMIIWSLFWLYLIKTTPSEHLLITREELNYIESNLDPYPTNYSVPWKKILTSVTVWAMAVALFSTFSFSFFALSELPLFLRYALGFTIDQTGILSGIAAILMVSVICMTGLILDKLRTICSMTVASKFIFVLALLVSILFLIILVFLKLDERSLITMCLFIIVVIPMIGVTPVMVNHLDFGGHYAGIILGLTNSIGSIPGFILPIITGYVVQDNYSKSQWNILFVILIFICAFGLIFYSIFGTAEFHFTDEEVEERQSILEKSTSIDDENSQ